MSIIIKDDLLDTPEKREQARANLTNLQGHAGFVLIQAMIQKNIDVVEAQILEDEDKNNDAEEMRFLKRCRKYLIMIRDLPKDTIDSITEATSSPLKEFDPYDEAK